MKAIENKKVSINSKETTYAEVICVCNDAAPAGGWTASTMAQAIKIDSLMKSDQDVINIEDADLVYIQKLIKEAKFTVKDIEIVNFCEYIKNIQ